MENALSAISPLNDGELNQYSAPRDEDVTDVQSQDGRTYRMPAGHVMERLKAWIDSPNIIFEDGFDDSVLGQLGMLVAEEYEVDEASRGEWLENNRKAMDLAMQVAAKKNYPWPNASSVIYPLITVAAIQFAARAYPAIVAGRNVVKGSVVGDDKGVPAPQGAPPVMGASPPNPVGAPLSPPGPGAPSAPPPAGAPTSFLVAPGAKASRATLIGEHMSWQLLDEQEEWEPEMDMLLHVLPIVGCEFKKSYFDPEKQRNASIRVSAEHVVINYRAKSMDRAPRITEEVEYYPLEIEEMVNIGLWQDFEGLRSAEENGGDKDAPIKFLEQHRWYDLDQDGMREPYIVTVHKATSKVVRIVARYDAEGLHWNATRGKIQKIEAVQYYTKFDFLPNPDGGIYGVGFGQLLRPMNEAVNSTLNMLLDAGHLANTQGGFIGKGLNMNSGSLRFQPGEYKLVNAPGGNIRDAIVKMDFPGPSTVLFQLLGMLVDAGKEIAAVKDVLTGEQVQANTPATTMLAMIEQGLKVFTGIYKRIHRSLKSEFTKLYRLNRIYLDDDTEFKAGDQWKGITREAYAKGDGVEPYSDPTMVSDMQKLGRAQFLMTFANDPMMDGREIRLRMLAAAAIDQPDKLLLPAPPPNPAILAKAMELHTKQAEVEAAAALKTAQAATETERQRLIKAQALQSLSAAIANLAAADKTVGDAHLGWLDHQLNLYKAEMENRGDPGDDTTPATPDAPPPPPEAGGPGGIAPPIAGALPPQPMGAP